MKGKAEKRKIEKITFSKQAKKRKPVKQPEDRFAPDIPWKRYHHKLCQEASKEKTGIGIEILNTNAKTPYYSQYKKMNKDTGKLELQIYSSINVAKVHASSFDERGIEYRFCLFVAGNKLCDLDDSYQEDDEIRAYSNNKGLHIFHQDCTWRTISSGYIKISTSKVIPNEDMSLFNEDAYQLISNKIYSLATKNHYIKRVIYDKDDMLIFEAHGAYVIKAMVMTNRELIKMNNNRRKKDLRSFTFDPKSSKNTDFYICFYTIPVKWYIDKAKESVEGIIKEITNSFKDDYVLDAKVSASYKSIDLIHGISFKEEEVKINE